MISNRHKRHSASQCVTCAGQNNRHKRHTPLWGVTTVTLVVHPSNLVPMPRFLRGGGVAGLGFLATHTAGVAHG